MQQRQLIDHFKGQALIGEELHAHMDNPVAKRIRIPGHFKHRWNATVVHHKCTRQMLLK